MPQFQLDTSGAVAIHGRRSQPNPAEFTAWDHLDPFTQGYVEALFFTEEERLCEESDGARHMPEVAINTATMESHFVGGDSFGFSDLAPCALASIIADCEAFQARAEALLNLAYDQPGYSEEHAGHDFWMTRNGHGVGFWDRRDLKAETPESLWVAGQAGEGCGTIGADLSNLCGWRTEWGEVSPYLGDDGKVYLS